MVDDGREDERVATQAIEQKRKVGLPLHQS